PLRHLIILIANAHPDRRPNRIGRKDQLLEICPMAAVRQANHMQAIERRLRRTAAINARSLTADLWSLPGPDSDNGTRTNLLFTISYRTSRRPKPAANLAFLRMTCPRYGGAGRDRTDDPLLAKQVLSQLSYGP